MKKRVLVLAAHADDEALGCGATIAKLAKMGHEIQLLTFTDGEGARGGSGKNRNEKLAAVSKILGIKNFAGGDFPDNAMDSVPLLDVCRYIEAQVKDQPDMIFTHHPDCLNIDHERVHRAAITVFRPQRGQAMDFFSFYVPSSTEWNPRRNFSGNTYFDVKEFVAAKVAALKVYENEMRPYPHARSYQNVENLMRVWGSEVGLEFAEKFESIRRVIT